MPQTVTTPSAEPRRPLAAGSEFTNEREVAARFGIPVATLRTWRSRRPKRGPAYVKVGKRVLYRVADVVAWLDARTVDPAARAGR